MVLVQDIPEALWDNAIMLKIFRMKIGETTELKGYEGFSLFRLIRRAVYLLSNTGELEFELKDLLCLAYAHYLRFQLLKKIKEGDHDLLKFGFKENQGSFLKNAKIVLKNFNKKRNKDNKKEDDETIKDGFEEKLLNKVDERLNDHLKIKEMLSKFTAVENRMKLIIAKTLVPHIEEYNESLKTQFPETERRQERIREYIRSESFIAILRKLFENYFFQDNYFKVFREIYLNVKYNY